MGKYDVTIVSGEATAPVITENVASGAVGSLKPGDAVKKNGNYVIRIATGDPEIATDEGIGIVQKLSTETAAADGFVDVLYPIPHVTIMRAKATTAGNIDTAAKLLGVRGDCVTFDLTGTVITVDEDETDDPNVHGLKIIGGDFNKGTLDFILQSPVGLGGGAVT